MSERKECVAMILAGGQGSRLGVLTRWRAKPAVPYLTLTNPVMRSRT